MTYIGVVVPSPACKRALRTAVDVLKKNGHQVVTMCVINLLH